MKCVKSKTSNGILGSGGIPGVEDMPATFFEYGDGTRAMESCWQLSWREWLRVLFTRRVYLYVMGHAHPPVYGAALSDVQSDQEGRDAT